MITQYEDWRYLALFGASCQVSALRGWKKTLLWPKNQIHFYIKNPKIKFFNMPLIIKSDFISWLKHGVRILKQFKNGNRTYGSWFMGFTYLRKYVNPINHEPYVWFQFLKLFWNPHNIFKLSYLITFNDLRYIKTILFGFTL